MAAFERWGQMIARLSRHLRANAVGYAALFVALGGSAYAAVRLPTNSVGTKQLRTGSVTGNKVARHTLTATNLGADSVGSSQLARGAVTNDKLARSSLSVTAGTGLKGGGPTALGGSTTLSVDPAAFQSRVTGSCSTGRAIASVAQNGTVGCQSAFQADVGQSFTASVDLNVVVHSSTVTVTAFVTAPDGSTTTASPCPTDATGHCIRTITVADPEFGTYTVGVQSSAGASPPQLTVAASVQPSRDNSPITLPLGSLSPAANKGLQSAVQYTYASTLSSG